MQLPFKIIQHHFETFIIVKMCKSGFLVEMHFNKINNG